MTQAQNARIRNLKKRLYILRYLREHQTATYETLKDYSPLGKRLRKAVSVLYRSGIIGIDRKEYHTTTWGQIHTVQRYYLCDVHDARRIIDEGQTLLQKLENVEEPDRS